MAITLKLNEKKKSIVEVRNIGFIKSMQDFVSGGDENEGYEKLIEETFNKAKDAMEDGYIVENVTIRPVNDTNVMVKLDIVKE